MNPCLCGFYGDSQLAMHFAPAMVTKHQKRISGPLLDRIDIYIEVPRVDYEKLSGDRLGESSETLHQRVQAARDTQNFSTVHFENGTLIHAERRRFSLFSSAESALISVQRDFVR